MNKQANLNIQRIDPKMYGQGFLHLKYKFWQLLKELPIL